MYIALTKEDVELTKFCSKEYNPKSGCEFIQLGTLSFFRNIEANKNIADPDEGTLRVGFGSFDTELKPNSKILNILPFTVTEDTKGARVNLISSVVEKEMANCYLFCLSINRKKKLSGKHFCGSYNSFFKIKIFKEFVNALASNLMQTVRLENFDTKTIKGFTNEISFLKNLKLTVVHGCVEYNQSKSSFIANNDSFEKAVIPDGLQIIFTKNASFAPDDEYRIAFIFSHLEKTVSVKKEPILVPCGDILKYIE